MISDIAVVGGGVAGISAVRSLRSEGYDGRLVLIGSEREYPYDRTCLSKSVLSGRVDEPPPLLPAEEYDALAVETIVNRRVLGVDPTCQEVLIEGGMSLKADRVLLATGARARFPRIPGADLPGVCTLRTIDDVRGLRRDWKPGQRILVVGGGLIGCEVATTARVLGLDVTILEGTDELLSRVLGRRVGGWCRARLEEIGVSVVLNAHVQEFTGPGALTGAIGADGTVYTGDSALVCVGAEPDTAVAEHVGIACSHGIVVNDSGGTTSEGLFAAGDAAAWPLQAGGRRSLETYLNSQEEGVAAASAMLGKSIHAPQLPLSWTEIAGYRLQTVGEVGGSGDDVIRGCLDEGTAVLFRVTEGMPTAAVSVNSPRDFSAAARMIRNGVHVRREALADPTVPLRDLARPGRGGRTGQRRAG